MVEMERKSMGKSEGSHNEQGNLLGSEWQARAKGILVNLGMQTDFKVEEVNQEDLRAVVENAQRSQRLHDATFSIAHEPGVSAGAAGSRLIWAEVMRW